MPKFKKFQTVTVDGCVGVIKDIRISEFTGRYMYLVFVPEWGDGTDGYRWFGESSLKNKEN